jgi:acid phosphatase
VSFWSASSPRNVETALYFADGFFGRDWSLPNATHPAHLHIIPESSSRGGNTLTPGDTCLLYVTDKTQGHDQGYAKLASWQSAFAPAISSRLSTQNPNLDTTFSPAEVYSMMEMCGFEVLARGSSPWCDIFSRSEWEDFEYGRDVLHFYRAGPGNRYSAAMGGLWLDATAKLLVQDSNGDGDDFAGSGEIYASFVHDGDIVPVLAALGLLDEEEEGEGEGQRHDLPTDHVKRNRKWRTSDIVPMAGRLIIERLNCRTPHGWRYRDARLFVNDGWVGWPVEGAEGKTVFVPQVEVGRFREMVGRKRQQGRGGFREVCGLENGVEEEIQFLHQ